MTDEYFDKFWTIKETWLKSKKNNHMISFFLLQGFRRSCYFVYLWIHFLTIFFFFSNPSAYYRESSPYTDFVNNGPTRISSIAMPHPPHSTNQYRVRVYFIITVFRRRVACYCLSSLKEAIVVSAIIGRFNFFKVLRLLLRILLRLLLWQVLSSLPRH